MKISVLLLSVAIIISPSVSFSAEDGITPEEILQKADEARAPKEAFLLHTEVIQYKNDKETGRASLDVFINSKNKYKSLARFLLPQFNRDRILLNTKDAVWIYIPGTKRVIRLSASQRLFGDASYGDILSVQFRDDYNAKLEGSEVREGRNCYRLYLSAKSASTAYASLRYWITAEEFYPWVCEYYALSGKLLKTAFFKSYREILGRMRPGEFEIRDAVKSDYKTIIFNTKMEYRDLPEKYFQKDYIGYIRWE